MTEYAKPLPFISEETRPFWDALHRHELRIPRCRQCRKYFFYPRSFCPFCLSDEIEWIKVSGKGKVYSYTVSYRAPSTGFAADVPYVFAIIELEEGVRLTSNVVGCLPEDVRIDMAVEVVFDDVTPEVTLAKFQPAEL